MTEPNAMTDDDGDPPTQVVDQGGTEAEVKNETKEDTVEAASDLFPPPAQQPTENESIDVKDPIAVVAPENKHQGQESKTTPMGSEGTRSQRDGLSQRSVSFQQQPLGIQQQQQQGPARSVSFQQLHLGIPQQQEPAVNAANRSPENKVQDNEAAQIANNWLNACLLFVNKLAGACQEETSYNIVGGDADETAFRNVIKTEKDVNNPWTWAGLLRPIYYQAIEVALGFAQGCTRIPLPMSVQISKHATNFAQLVAIQVRINVQTMHPAMYSQDTTTFLRETQLKALKKYYCALR